MDRFVKPGPVADRPERPTTGSPTRRLSGLAWVLAAASGLAVGPAARADPLWATGNILVSRSVYQDVGDVANLKVGDPLPGGGNAVANGTYPNVFNNASVDSSFGVTSPIFIDQYTRGGSLVNSLSVPTSGSNGVATSFPSKSELALNLATDGKSITFMAYSNPGVGKLDVSNSNTPGVVDPTNPVKSSFSRAVVQIDAFGNVTVIPTNAYSGNNGRAAVYDARGNQYLLVGNAGNGSGTPPDNVVKNTGVQTATPGGGPDTTVVGQHQGTVGAATGSQYGYSVTQNGYNKDKSGKDNNYRGETIFNNTLYVSKGSGGNGINTVYQVSVPGGGLPTPANASLATFGILPGFSTVLANGSNGTPLHPFGLWFADANTLYVGDEGDGSHPGADGGGLQKWSLVGGAWQLDYTLTNGLGTNQPYTLRDYPTTTTDGLRNISGIVNGDGTVTIYGVTSTVSASGDQGADPNMVMVITDNLSYTTAGQAAAEQFSTFAGPAYGTIYRGVSPAASAAPEPSGLVLALTGLGGAVVAAWRRRRAGRLATQ
jgi:hypothetical protein